MKRVFSVAALISLSGSAFVRLFYYIFVYQVSVEAYFLVSQIAIPVASCLLFAVFIAGGHIDRTWIPALGGCLFFVLKALDFEPVHMVLCLALYAAAGVVYVLFLRRKMPPLMASIFYMIPLLVHAAMDVVEIRELILTGRQEEIIGYIPELSVLLIMLGLVLICASMIERNTNPSLKTN